VREESSANINCSVVCFLWRVTSGVLWSLVTSVPDLFSDLQLFFYPRSSSLFLHAHSPPRHSFYFPLYIRASIRRVQARFASQSKIKIEYYLYWANTIYNRRTREGIFSLSKIREKVCTPVLKLKGGKFSNFHLKLDRRAEQQQQEQSVCEIIKFRLSVALACRLAGAFSLCALSPSPHPPRRLF
jgi:hypothetical protein